MFKLNFKFIDKKISSPDPLQRTDKVLNQLKKHMSNFIPVFKKITDGYFEYQRSKYKPPLSISERDFAFVKSFTNRGDTNAIVKMDNTNLVIGSNVKRYDGKLYTAVLKEKKLRGELIEGMEFRDDGISQQWEGPYGKRKTTTRDSIPLRVIPVPITSVELNRWFSFFKKHVTDDFEKIMKGIS